MVEGMSTRSTTLSRAILASVGGLCFGALVYLNGQLLGGFIGDWVTEGIGVWTGIDEAQVRSVIADWLPAAAIIVTAMWVTFIVTRWRFRDAHPQAPVIPGIDREALRGGRANSNTAISGFSA